MFSSSINSHTPSAGNNRIFPNTNADSDTSSSTKLKKQATDASLPLIVQAPATTDKKSSSAMRRRERSSFYDAPNKPASIAEGTTFHEPHLSLPKITRDHDAEHDQKIRNFVASLSQKYKDAPLPPIPTHYNTTAISASTSENSILLPDEF